VSKVVVDLGTNAAHVECDGDKVKPEDLIAAVAKAPGAMGEPYVATVKQ